MAKVFSIHELALKPGVTPEEFEQRVLNFLHRLPIHKGETQSNGTQTYLSH